MPHKKLEAWKKSIDFVTEIYKLTKIFPKSETFGLTQQMKRSAISIPSNIAEGCSRKSCIETIQFLYIATSSVSELETQLIIANKVDYIADEDTEIMLKSLNEIKRMLIGLIKSLKTKSPK